jgi:hypothetical protein
MTKRHFWRSVGLGLIVAIACSYFIQPGQLWGQSIPDLTNPAKHTNVSSRNTKLLNPEHLPTQPRSPQAVAKLKAEKDKPDQESDKVENGIDLEPFAEVIKDTEKQEGLFTLYRKEWP